MSRVLAWAGNLSDLVPRPQAASPADGQNRAVDLARIAWLSVVIACMIAVVILLFQGYYGYAGVTFAVAASAGINLR